MRKMRRGKRRRRVRRRRKERKGRRRREKKMKMRVSRHSSCKHQKLCRSLMINTKTIMIFGLIEMRVRTICRNTMFKWQD
jgi:hypothetical protein